MLNLGTTLNIYKSEIYSLHTGIDVVYYKTDASIKCVLNFTKHKYSFTLFTIDLKTKKLNGVGFNNNSELNKLLQNYLVNIEIIKSNLNLFVYRSGDTYYRYETTGSTKLSIFDIDYYEFKNYLIMNGILTDTKIIDFIFNETKDFILCKKVLFHVFHN